MRSGLLVLQCSSSSLTRSVASSLAMAVWVVVECVLIKLFIRCSSDGISRAAYTTGQEGTGGTGTTCYLTLMLTQVILFLFNFLWICVLFVRDYIPGLQIKSNYLCPGSWHGRMDSATSQPLLVTTRAQLLLSPPPPHTRSSVLPGRRPPRACSLSSSSRCPTTSTTTVKGTYCTT